MYKQQETSVCAHVLHNEKKTKTKSLLDFSSFFNLFLYFFKDKAKRTTLHSNFLYIAKQLLNKLTHQKRFLSP